MDPIFFVEIAIVGLIMATQIWVFVKNSQAIRSLGQLIPPASQVRLLPQAQGKAANLQAPAASSPAFQEIVLHSNSYLDKNPGAVRFIPLRDIAVARTESLAQAIEANLPLPLYIGLLCTFTGVIIGLVEIAFIGVTEAAIQAFIGGVLIGMVGSAAGLAMTTRSNFAYKNARQLKDEKLEGYLELLRREVVAQESAPNIAGIEGLRSQLSAFHDGFRQYQEYVNQSLSGSLRLFQDLKLAFGEVQQVEHSLQSIGRSLQGSDSLISRQQAFFEQYATKAEDMSRRLQATWQQAEDITHQAVDQRIRQLDQSSQAAFVKMDQYLAALGGDRQVAAAALSKEFGSLQQEVNSLQAANLQVGQQLLQVIQATQQREIALHQELKELKAAMATPGRPFTDSWGFRLFVLIGSLASLAALGGLSFYVYQTYFA